MHMCVQRHACPSMLSLRACWALFRICVFICFVLGQALSICYYATCILTSCEHTSVNLVNYAPSAVFERLLRSVPACSTLRRHVSR